VTPAAAQTTADARAAFIADLVSGETATRVLERWCGTPILAQLAAIPARAPSADQRSRLKVGANDLLASRHVGLMAGAEVLSDASLWYVPARLTPEMNALLADGATPFGAVIGALGPTRHTLSCRSLEDETLAVRALVLCRDGVPLAEAEERYRFPAITG
jgi:hypothetical protein